MNSRLPVGLIGCGRWGRYILRDLVALGCEVFVVAQSPVSVQFAQAGGAAAVFNHIAALPDIAGAVVATPTSTHAAVLEQTLMRGVPVFVEKPLTDDAASALRLAERAPDRLFVMDKWRYHAGVELLAQIARTEELGPVLGLHTTRVQWGSGHTDSDCAWVLLPHDLSIALEIFGTLPTPREAVAERINGTLTSLIGTGLIGTGLIGTGLIGTLVTQPWHAFEVSSRSPIAQRMVRLHCRDGIAVLNDGYSQQLEIIRTAANFYDKTPPVIEPRAFSNELPLLRELRAFVAHLQGGPPPRSSAAEGALIVQTIAQLRALADGKTS